MARLSGAYDDSPIAISGYPSEIAEQLRYDAMSEDIAQHGLDPYLRSVNRILWNLSDIVGGFVPIRVSALTADRRPVAIPIGGDTLNLTYKPSAINAVQEARELEEREKGRHLLAQARSLSEIILSWDLLDDEGQALPVSSDVIATFGIDIVSKLTRAILDDLLPNRTPPATSSNGSSAAAG